MGLIVRIGVNTGEAVVAIGGGSQEHGMNQVGLTGSHVALAHCVHLSKDEIETLLRTKTNVVHCPSSNLKLGSGIAPVAELLERGVSVSLEPTAPRATTASTCLLKCERRCYYKRRCTGRKCCRRDALCESLLSMAQLRWVWMLILAVSK